MNYFKFYNRFFPLLLVSFCLFLNPVAADSSDSGSVYQLNLPRQRIAVLEVEDRPYTFEFDLPVPGESWSRPQEEDDLTYAWMTSPVSTVLLDLATSARIELRVAGANRSSLLDSVVIKFNNMELNTVRTDLDEDPRSELGDTVVVFVAEVDTALIRTDLEVQTLSIWLDSDAQDSDADEWLAIDSITISPGEVGDPLCTPLFTSAIGVVEDRCTRLGSNEACYGNPNVELRSDSSVRFDEPGDVVRVEQISSMRLSSMSDSDIGWGLSLMRVLADVQNPENANTSLILFGDASIADETEGFIGGVPSFVNVDIDVLNVRSRPSIDGDIIAQLREGVEVLIVDGPRVADGYTWWYIEGPNGADGWAVDMDEGAQTLIFATVGRLVPDGRATVYVTERDNLRLRSGPGLSYERIDGLPNETRVSIIDGPVDADGYRWWQLRTSTGLEGWAVDFADGLPTLTAQSSGPRFGPMQAFAFDSGTDSPTCLNMPNGMLIQTQAGQGEIRFLVNEVAIQINTESTAYIESDPSEELVLSTIEGSVRVEAGGIGRVVTEGAQVYVPINNQYEITGPVSILEPYDEAKIRRLPLDLLERDVVVPEAGVSIFAGLGSGDVQVTLSWDNDADMDLHVIEPNGDEIWYANRISRSEGQLDVDSNVPCGANLGSLENIYWPTDSSPNGRYQVYISEFSQCGDGVANWDLYVRVEGVLVLQESGSGSSPMFSFNR